MKNETYRVPGTAKFVILTVTVKKIQNNCICVTSGQEEWKEDIYLELLRTIYEAEECESKIKTFQKMFGTPV
jgi:hypothetical protein